MNIFKQARRLAALTVLFAPGFANALSCGDGLLGSVTLTADLHCSSGPYALDVQANGITINLNGHTLSGTSAVAGITIVGYNNVTIRGPGRITGFWTGMSAVRADGLTIRNVTFEGMTSGLNHNHARGGQIVGNEFKSITGTAVSLHATAFAPEPVLGNSIDGNRMEDVGTGVELCGAIAQDNEIANNEIGARDIGIALLDQANQNLIHSNFVNGAGIAALALRNSSSNEIFSEYYKNSHVGVWLVSEPPITCAHSASLPMATAYNQLDGITLVENLTAMLFGGGSATAEVYKNEVVWSKVYDNNVGADLRPNSIKNRVQYNAFHGTLTPLLDAGLHNITSPNFP